MPKILSAEKFSVPAENFGNLPAELLHEGVCSVGCYRNVFAVLLRVRKIISESNQNSFLFFFSRVKGWILHIEQDTNEPWGMAGLGETARANLSVRGFDYFHISCNIAVTKIIL